MYLIFLVLCISFAFLWRLSVYLLFVTFYYLLSTKISDFLMVLTVLLCYLFVLLFLVITYVIWLFPVHALFFPVCTYCGRLLYIFYVMCFFSVQSVQGVLFYIYFPKRYFMTSLFPSLVNIFKLYKWNAWVIRENYFISTAVF